MCLVVLYYIPLTYYTLVYRPAANSGINMGTVSAIHQERFEKIYYGRWLVAKEMSPLLGYFTSIITYHRLGHKHRRGISTAH